MSVEGTMAAVGVQEVTLFLIVAILTGVLTKYFIRIQYIAALVIVGAILGLTPIFGGIEVRADIIYYVFLPLILFEGGLAIHIRHFRETVDVMLILAFPGLIVAMILVGYCVHILFDLPLLIGMLLGAIVMPTDPVSVIATFKKLGAPPRLTTIIEGESVLNDGAGIVAFGVVMGLIAAGEVNIPHAAIDFVRVSAGGAIVGILMGYVGTRILQYVDDHIFEVTITIIIAFATFLLAEHFHVSGIIAVVFAGLIVGNYGERYMAPPTRLTVSNFWEVVVFIVNAFIFLLIGIELTVGSFLEVGILNLVAFIFLVLAARGLIVYCTGIFYRLIKRPIPMSWQHVLVWGGLHATVPLALVLSVPKDMPERELLLTLTLAVVFFSLLVQGMSMDKFARKLGLIGLTEERREYERRLGLLLGLKGAMREVKDLMKSGAVHRSLAEKIIREYKNFEKELNENLRCVLEEHCELGEEEERMVRRASLES
ncbi:Na+/H+ antiporter [Methanosarcinales archaeon]|nr:MAG: Na+/H+ antiporter [Methanosarcinales archaeon]